LSNARLFCRGKEKEEEEEEEFSYGFRKMTVKKGEEKKGAENKEVHLHSSSSYRAKEKERVVVHHNNQRLPHFIVSRIERLKRPRDQHFFIYIYIL
jgi:hypothetical protein